MLVWYGLTAGARNRTRMIFFKIFSRGCPFFSYSPSSIKGAARAIRRSRAASFPRVCRVKKYPPAPKRPPREKQMICRLVRPKATLSFTSVKSLVMVT